MYQNFTLESAASQPLNTATHSCHQYAKCIQSYLVDTWKAPSPESTPNGKLCAFTTAEPVENQFSSME